MSNLIIEIGNTALKAAWADGVTLGKNYRYQGENKIDFIIGLTEEVIPELMIVASVSEISIISEDKLKRCCHTLIVLDPKHKTLLKQTGLPDYMSYDRCASIVASRYLFSGRSCSIFDFGTVLSVDSIDKEGTYIDGKITLGCGARFKALNRYSRNLPLIRFNGSDSSREGSLGYSIEEGIILGIVFEIRGWIENNNSEVLVFTGGDAFYFAKRMKNSIFVICNLVLIGLAIIAKNYVEQDN